jgi:FixJ family two-component response regulator
MVVNTTVPVVYIVDDDISLREALSSLVRSMGLHAEAFSSAQEFLECSRREEACLVLDVRLPGLSGLDLQRELAEAGSQIPIIFMTGHGDIPMTVHAMKAGAFEFLPKPLRDQDLLDAIRQALEWSRTVRQQSAERGAIQMKYDTLTSREREVMRRVVGGMSNKHVARDLDLGEGTIKVHRRRIMDKMSASSLADLVRMADRVAADPAVGRAHTKA